MVNNNLTIGKISKISKNSCNSKGKYIHAVMVKIIAVRNITIY